METQIQVNSKLLLLSCYTYSKRGMLLLDVLRRCQLFYYRVERKEQCNVEDSRLDVCTGKPSRKGTKVPLNEDSFEEQRKPTARCICVHAFWSSRQSRVRRSVTTNCASRTEDRLIQIYPMILYIMIRMLYILDVHS